MNGSIFFYSLNGDGSLEWIGSAMIWVLLAMSLANVVLIALSTAGNARKGVLPEHAPAAVREMLAVTNAMYGPESDFTSLCRVIESWAGVTVRG